MDIPYGNKTALLFEHLEKGVFLEKINGEIVTGNFTDFSTKPSICLGANPLCREAIRLDPLNCPLLDEKYQLLVQGVKGLSEEAILQATAEYVESLFEARKGSPLYLGLWLKNYPAKERLMTIEGYLPIIDLDEFLEAGVGVCRHFTYVGAYFIDRLIREGYLRAGKVHYIRDVLEGELIQGGHAWLLYISDEGAAWHIDPSFQIILNLREENSYSLLSQYYGKIGIDDEKKRFNLP